MLATGGVENGRTRLWDVATRRLIGTVTNPVTRHGIYAVAFSPDGRMLATGDQDGLICLWDLATKRRTMTMRVPRGSGVYAAAFGPRGAVLANGDFNGHTYLWRVGAR